LATKLKYSLLSILLASASSFAGESTDGRSYTNFGADLLAPIFPINGLLSVYKNKFDARPIVTLNNLGVVNQRGESRPCKKGNSDGWVYCTVGTVTGWIKHADFRTGGEYAAVASWPFRYWLYIASPGTGSEDAVMLREIVPKVPYLVAPTEYTNIFFHVIFDMQGRAISPKSHRPTGDRVFLIGDAIYLAPGDPKKRNRADWLFLSFYNKELNAMCPARNPDSCMSAVNLGADWPGIKAMYEEPPERFRRKDNDTAWYGAGEVAFARHIDPVRPLMYRVPDDVIMSIDPNPITDAERAKNREKLFCIADCGNP
jgi:hypothetical protein